LSERTVRIFRAHFRVVLGLTTGLLVSKSFRIPLNSDLSRLMPRHRTRTSSFRSPLFPERLLALLRDAFDFSTACVKFWYCRLFQSFCNTVVTHDRMIDSLSSACWFINFVFRGALIDLCVSAIDIRSLAWLTSVQRCRMFGEGEERALVNSFFRSPSRDGGCHTSSGLPRQPYNFHGHKTCELRDERRVHATTGTAR
jgi:hypothetical protein